MIGPRIALILTGALATAGHGADAETLRIRAGEHGDFTRLVLEFTIRPRWRAGRTEAGYAIGFDVTEPLEADISQVYRRIGRDRVAAITVQSDYQAIEIDLACACAAEIFDFNQNAIVIDVRPGAPRALALYEAPFAPELPNVTRPLMKIEQPRPPDVISKILETPSTISRHSPEVRHSILPRADALIDTHVGAISRHNVEFDPTSAADTLFAPAATSVEPATGVSSAAVAAVAEQLSRAAIQGLIDPAEAVPPGNNAVEPAHARPGPTNFRALTSIDRDTEAAARFAESTRTGALCIPDNKVRIADWGDPANVALLGRKRHAAIAEDGQLTEAGRLELARYYIVLGFGAEARMVAESLPPGQDRGIILALSEIIDSGKSDASVLDGQLSCSGGIALWAALARPFTAVDLPSSPDAILAVFSALPRHLREHLGPVLSERLRAAGQNARARTALNAVTRAGRGSVQQDLTAARLGLTDTAPMAARLELERIARGTDFAAAEALLELLLDADRRNVAPKPAWVDDAPSLIRVTDGTEIADRLSIAALFGHIPLERFDELRLALNEDHPGLTDQVRTRIAARALASAVAVEGDADFLRAKIGFSRHAVAADLDDETRLAMAARLLDMGSAGLASEYLPDFPETDASSALAARVFHATGRTQTAMAVVPAAATSEFSAIRARLLEDSGQLTEASREYLLADDENGAVRTALRSGDWPWIASEENSPLVDALQNILESRPTYQNTDNAGKNTELINELSVRRTAYDLLLDRAAIHKSE